MNASWFIPQSIRVVTRCPSSYYHGKKQNRRKSLLSFFSTILNVSICEYSDLVFDVCWQFLRSISNRHKAFLVWTKDETRWVNSQQVWKREVGCIRIGIHLCTYSTYIHTDIHTCICIQGKIPPFFIPNWIYKRWKKCISIRMCLSNFLISDEICFRNFIHTMKFQQDICLDWWTRP